MTYNESILSKEQRNTLAVKLIMIAGGQGGVLTYKDIKDTLPIAVVDSSELFEPFLVLLTSLDIIIIEEANAPSPILRKQAKLFMDKIWHDNDILLIPYEEERWFRGAYSTIQRTLRDGYVPLTSEQKAKCRSEVIDGILQLPADDFDNALKELILKISKDYKISIGHSQKIISIIIKYAFCVYQVDRRQLPEQWRMFVSKCEQKLPVPIDAFVLHALKTNYKDMFPDVWSYKNNKKGTAPSASVRVNQYEQSTWSRLNDYDVYWSLQERIRDLAVKVNMTPMEFEVRKLWVVEDPV